MSSAGSFLIALSILIFIVNAVRTQRKPKGLDDEDPWDARTLEWTTSCPPPVYNFEEIPQVHALDEFWHRKYVQDEKTGTLVPVQAGSAPPHDEGHEDAGHGIHLPSPSYWPLVSAIGLPTIGYGILYSWWLVGAGALIALIGFFGWAMEPSVAGD